MENQDMTSTGATNNDSGDTTVLVVTSKVKKYIKETAGMNTAGDVAEALTKLVITEIQAAVNRAKDSGRKTVMGRDIATTTTTTL